MAKKIKLTSDLKMLLAYFFMKDIIMNRRKKIYHKTFPNLYRKIQCEKYSWLSLFLLD